MMNSKEILLLPLGSKISLVISKVSSLGFDPISNSEWSPGDLGVYSALNTAENGTNYVTVWCVSRVFHPRIQWS